MRRWWCVIGLGLLALPLGAQRRERVGGGGRSEVLPNVPYDGRLTFARIRYSTGQQLGGFRGGWSQAWSHDYPRAERHFTKILAELSTLRVRTDASNVLTLDDPELFKYPIAYLCEPGFWLPSDAEVAGLRAYLEKGGFLIVDDFEGSHWYNFEAQMRRVLPQGRLMQLTADHPIFDSFYRVRSLDYVHPYFGTPSTFHGIFEDNDATRRLMVIVNYNNDVAEYWEFSDIGLFPLDLSNEAYKLGVNYIVYALSR
jgi:uncharacterized protein DUF4159